MKVRFYSAIAESGGEEWKFTGEIECDEDEVVTFHGPAHFADRFKGVRDPDGELLTPDDGAEFVYACYLEAQGSYSKAVIVNDEEEEDADTEER
jgi:hypothetical protein